MVWGALTDRRWTVPVACMLALPALWYGGLTMLLAVIVLRQPDLGRPVRERRPGDEADEAVSGRLDRRPGRRSELDRGARRIDLGRRRQVGPGASPSAAGARIVTAPNRKTAAPTTNRPWTPLTEATTAPAAGPMIPAAYSGR